MFDPCTGDDVTIGVTTKHKEEGVRRRDLDTADRNLVMHELNTHAHPLTDLSSDLVNIVNRKVADKSINVVDTVSIGEDMSLDFVKSLPDGFHNRLTNRVKTMETMKQGVVVGEKTVYDMEALFSRLSDRVETLTSQLYSNMSCVQCLHLSLTSLVSFAKGVKLSL